MSSYSIEGAAAIVFTTSILKTTLSPSTNRTSINLDFSNQNTLTQIKPQLPVILRHIMYPWGILKEYPCLDKDNPLNM